MRRAGGVVSDPDVEVFPVAIGKYLHHVDLDAIEAEVEEVAWILSEFGGVVVPWGDPMPARGHDAVHRRVGEWADRHTGNTFLYWVGHGWSNGDSALLLHFDSANPPGDNEPDVPACEHGVTPAQLAEWIDRRERHNQSTSTWSIIVVNTCKSAQFVELLNAALDRLDGPRRVLLVGVSGEGETYLGTFSRALRGAVRDTFGADPEIDLWELGKELLARLPSHTPPFPRNVHQLRLTRRVPLPDQATLDMAQTIQAALFGLGDDGRHHYFPKAQGGELRELAWYFEGRVPERRRIVDWLRVETSGILAVTGQAGSGKSALLGNLLVHSQPELRDTMVSAGLLEPLPDAERAPDGVFSAAVHLTGMTAPDLIARFADDLRLPTPRLGATLAEQADALVAAVRDRGKTTTLLIDAFDESNDPIGIAQSVLRPLSALPGVRLLVGTRGSTFENLGDSAPPDRDLLDALGVRPDQTVAVERDGQSLRRYTERRLTAAAKEGKLVAGQQVINLVAAAIGDVASDFLFARLAVHEILAEPGLLSPQRMDDFDELTRATHDGLFSKAVRRLRRSEPVNHWLLAALAHSMGRGVPLRDGVWAAAAKALSAGTAVVTNEDISTLLTRAAPYIAIDREFGQTVYRLAHSTFVSHFTNSSENQRRHLGITRELIALGDGPLNPYLVNHLPAHAGAGGQRAWRDLAARPKILDELNPTAVAGAVTRSAFGRFMLPHPIAGIVSASHLVASAEPGERAVHRWLGAARHTGSAVAPPSGTADSGRWCPGWTLLVPRPLHIMVTGQPTGRSRTHDNNESIAAITSFALPRHPGLLAAGQSSGLVHIWDPQTGGRIGEPLVHDTGVRAIVAFQLDARGRVGLAVITESGISVWEAVLRRLMTTIESPVGSRFRSVAAVPWPDGHVLLVAGCEDGTIAAWDPHTGTRVGDCAQAHQGSVNAISPLGPEWPGPLATHGQDGEIRIWHHEDKRWKQTASRVPEKEKRSAGFALTTVRLSPQRELLVSGGTDKLIRLWSATEGSPVHELEGHGNAVRTITAVRMPNGDAALVSAGDDRGVRIWDPYRHCQIGVPLTGHTAQILGVTELGVADGPGLVASGSRDGSVRLWQLTDTGKPHTAGRPAAPVNALAEVELKPGAPVIAVGQDGGLVRLLNIETGQDIRPALEATSGSVKAVGALRVSEELNLLAASGSDKNGSSDKIVKVWNLARPGVRTFLSVPTQLETITSMAIVANTDGTVCLAMAGKGGAIEFWNLLKRKLLARQPGQKFKHTPGLVTVRLPTGDTLVASSHGDNSVRFWDPGTGHPANLPPIDNGGTISAMSPVTDLHGHPLLAVAGVEDRVRIRIWDVATGELDAAMGMASNKQSGTPPGGGGRVTALTRMRTPSGQDLLISGNRNHTITVWDAANHNVLHRLEFGEAITACHACGTRLLIASESGLTMLKLNQW